MALLRQGRRHQTSFLTNTTIRKSASNAIELAWSGPTASYLATNTFSGIAGCIETEPKHADGTCPATPRCQCAP